MLGHRSDTRRVVELGAHHQAETTHLGDPVELVLQRLDPLAELRAPRHDVGEERRVLHDLDGGQSRRTAHCIAAVGTPVTARRPLVVDVATGAERSEREAAGDALGHADDVGLDAVVVDREHAAGATETALHLVGDEEDPVLTAPLDDAVDERSGSRDVATFTEHRFEDDGSGLVRRRHRLEQVVEPGKCFGHLGVLVGRERVGVRGDEDAGGQRCVPGAIAGLRGGHRHRQVGATVEAAAEHDGVRALRGLLGQLDRSLGDLCARVRVEERVDAGGGELGELGRQGLEEVVLVDVDLRVDEPLRLLGDRLRDVWVGVSGGVHRDAGGEVEVLLAVGGGDPATSTAGHLERRDREPDVGQVRQVVRHGVNARSPRRIHLPGTDQTTAWTNWPVGVYSA